MVSVNVSSKFRSLYRYATGQISRPSGSVQRFETAVEPSGKPYFAIPLSNEMPLEKNRIMRPGKRALAFTGTSLISAQSETLEDGAHYKLDIFQRADEQFVMRLNKADSYGTLRLLLTCEARNVSDIEAILNGLDAGKFVSFLPLIDSSNQTQSEKALYIDLNNRLVRARAQYTAFINSIFADSDPS